MRILFATDGSQGSAVALDLLLSLPHRPEDRIDVVSVPVHRYVGAGVEGTGVFIAEVVEAEIADATRAAAGAVARLQARGVAGESRVAEGPAAEAILAAAGALGSDLIVVGSRGHGRIAGALLGSTARALARHSPVPVLVVRERREAPRRILVAADGSPDSRAAVAALASMPLVDHAEITLLYVARESMPPNMPEGQFADELRAAIERNERMDALETLRQAAGILPSCVTVRLETERGPAADRILEVAGAKGADLIVLGSRGTTLGSGFLQGSTADRVLGGAHCAVLVARAPVPVGDRPEPSALAASAG